MTHYKASPEQNSEVIEVAELVGSDERHLVNMDDAEFSHLGEKLAQVRAAIAATAMHGVEDQFTIISSDEYLKP